MVVLRIISVELRPGWCYCSLTFVAIKPKHLEKIKQIKFKIGAYSKKIQSLKTAYQSLTKRWKKKFWATFEIQMFTEFLLYFQDQLIQNGWFCQFDDSFHNTGGLSGQIVEMTLIVWLDQCLFICIFSSVVCLFVYF